MAILTTDKLPFGCTTAPSLGSRPADTAICISERSRRARVTAMLGRMSMPSPISGWNASATMCPQGSSETMVRAPVHCLKGPMATAGCVLVRSARRMGLSAPEETASAR